jgi:hypothetical protein
MHLQRERAAKPNWPERPVRLSSLGLSGKSSIQVHTCMGCLAAGRIQRSPSGPLILISSDIFAFSQHLDDIAGSDQAVGAVRRKSSPFQHVWQCLIYSGVYLFQFARHMALLLKTSSALPAHHCIRQASRPQGWPPSRVLSLPTAGAHCSSRWYRRASDDQSGRGPATVYALRAHRLRVKLYSNHPLSNASLVAILLCKATPL